MVHLVRLEDHVRVPAAPASRARMRLGAGPVGAGERAAAAVGAGADQFRRLASRGVGRVDGAVVRARVSVVGGTGEGFRGDVAVEGVLGGLMREVYVRIAEL